MDPAIFHNPAAPALVAAGPVRVLDRGHVALLHCAGTDALVAHAARASYGREGEPKTPEQDARLVRRLMHDAHTSPFEMPETWWHVKLPIHVDRQWVRHRTWSRSERSARYTEVGPDEFHRTAPGAWRLQSTDNKQGSAGTLPEHADFNRDLSVYAGGDAHSYREGQILDDAAYVYSQRIKAGIAREQARKDLPLSTYTEWVGKVDLHNLLHFLRLRLAPDAQLEIRQYAQAIAGIVEQLFPVTWGAFREYRLEATTWSATEMIALSVAIDAVRAAFPVHVGPETFKDLFPSDRERAACRSKLARLGLVAAEGGAA